MKEYKRSCWSAGTNLTDAQETVAAIAEDAPDLPAPRGSSLHEELRQRGIQVLAPAALL